MSQIPDPVMGAVFGALDSVLGSGYYTEKGPHNVDEIVRDLMDCDADLEDGDASEIEAYVRTWLKVHNKEAV